MAYRKESAVLPGFFIICLILLIVSVLTLNGTGIVFSLIGLALAGLRFYQKKVEFDKMVQNRLELKEKPKSSNMTIKTFNPFDDPYSPLPDIENPRNTSGNLTEAEFQLEIRIAERSLLKTVYRSEEKKFILIGKRLIQIDARRTVKYLFNNLGVQNKNVTSSIIEDFKENYLLAVLKYIPNARL